MEKKASSLKIYLIAIALPLLVGGLSALCSRGNMDIYDTVNVPPFAPPTVLFPIVWTILYILMGVSAARVFLRRENDPAAARDGLGVFLVQLIVNFFWTIFFFNLQAFLFSFIWLLLLIALIAVMICLFLKVDRLAACLQVPYLLWCVFAACLSCSIWLLNR